MADNDQPADDLRSLLAGAIEESAAAAADATPKAVPVTGTNEKGETVTEMIVPEPKGDDRPRGPDGKFLKKDGEADDDKPAAKTEAKDNQEAKPEAKADADKGKDGKTAEPKADDSKEPPAKWSASDKAMFKLQTPEAQAFLLRRAAQIDAEFTKRNQEIVDLKKEYEPVQQLFAPHLDTLKQKGLSPSAVIKRWADVETGLATPSRNVDVVDNIIKAYNVDRAALAKRLGFTSSPSGAQSTETSAATTDPARGSAADGVTTQLPPQVMEELRQLREGFQSFQQREQNARTAAIQQKEAAVETEISNFKSAVTDKGELLHPYFEEVEPAMIALAQSYVARKQQPPPIADLYDMAVYANPSTRQALLATQRVAQEAKAAEEARAKAASARRAASSVTGAPGSGQSSRPVRGELSLREQIEEAAADSAAA